MKTSIKQVFESDNWIITKIMQGLGTYRIDAKRRHPIADEKNFFSEWGSKTYVERLSKENYGKSPSEFSCFHY
jgi:hypothetical protein